MSVKGWDKEEANARWRARKLGVSYRRPPVQLTKEEELVERENKNILYDLLMELEAARKREREQHKILAGEYSLIWTKKYKNSLKARDNNTCFLCGKIDKPAKLHLHHVNYLKYDCDPQNLITLCASCHPKTNHNREAWRNLFHRHYRITRLVQLSVPAIILRKERGLLVKAFQNTAKCPLPKSYTDWLNIHIKRILNEYRTTTI